MIIVYFVIFQINNEMHTIHFESNVKSSDECAIVIVRANIFVCIDQFNTFMIPNQWKMIDDFDLNSCS